MSRSERTTTERRAPDPAQVVLYAVALLALADCDGDAWSLDARVFGRRPKPAPGPGAPRGSAARRLLQLAVASQFFFSGLAKVRGIAPGPLLGWFDGSLLYGALFKQAGYASAPLHGFLLRRPGLAPPLAAAALALELAGPVALACYPRSSSSWPPRRAVAGFAVAGFAAFHVVIKAVMVPNFALNVAAYCLIVDWTGPAAAARGAAAALLAGDGPAPRAAPPPPERPRRDARPYATRHRAAAAAAAAAAAGLFCAGAVGYDRWPLTDAVLYANHPSGPGRSRPHDARTFAAAAARCAARPWVHPLCAGVSGSVHRGRYHLDARHWVTTLVATASNGSFAVAANWRAAADRLPEPPRDLAAYARVRRGAPVLRGSLAAGLNWRAADAAALSAARGAAPCLAAPAAPPDPASPASALARSVKRAMTNSSRFLGADVAVVEVAVVVTLRPRARGRDFLACAVGAAR